MNDKQALVLYIGAVLETLVLLFPPIVTSIISISGPFDRFIAVYGAEAHTFLFAWPGKPIDVGRLLCAFLLVLVLTAWAVIGFRDKPGGQKAQDETIG